MTSIAYAPEIEPYHLLRTALAVFKKTPNELNEDELATVMHQAQGEYEIENRVLSSTEAAAVIVTEEALLDALDKIRERFEDEESFLAELEQNDLQLDSLKQSLQRQCKVESVLEIIGSKAAKVSDVEVGIYYHMHPEKFHRPEQRSVRHILITVNDDYQENTRENATKRINEIAARLKTKPHKFADLALKHSECPTALQGGQLGTYAKGKLYPEIDAVLFQMKAGQISDVVETEAGLHLVLCERILPADTLSLKKAGPKIRELMQERSRRTCQRAWLASLPSSASKHSK